MAQVALTRVQVSLQRRGCPAGPQCPGLCIWAQWCLLLVTLWTIDCQAPLSMRVFWQEYWSGLPVPTPEDLLHAVP